VLDKIDVRTFSSWKKKKMATTAMLHIDQLWYCCRYHDTTVPKTHPSSIDTHVKQKQTMKALRFKSTTTDPKSPPPKLQHLGSSRNTSTSTAVGSSTNKKCYKCQTEPIAFRTDPCGHLAYCTRCAMKLCTGGKCQVCHEYYGGMKRVLR